LPTADFKAPEDTVREGRAVRFPNLSAGASAYIWDFGDGNTSAQRSPTHTYTESGDFEVHLVAAARNDCRDTARKRVIVRLDRVLFPNAFTPNGDGTNDYFIPHTNFTLAEGVMDIYNQWGTKIYTAPLPGPGWNGTDAESGTGVPEGVYVFTFEGTSLVGQKFEAVGTITLIR
jgi:gliding motility-associated-like protein